MDVKRLRHKGTGPKRNTIPTIFEFPFQVPPVALRDLMDIVKTHYDVDDINSEHYPVADSKYVDLANHIPEGFRDIALQWHEPGSDGLDEKSYTVWNDRAGNGAFREFMETHFPKAFRIRIGHMPPDGGELNWHIDTNSTVAVRCQIPITHRYNDEQIEFNVRTKDGIETANQEVGSVFMTNTAWPHRVVNHTKTSRFTCVFSIEYNDLIAAGAPTPTKG